jgi:16S rRNA (cytosine967-C5)-methyltransferase
MPNARETALRVLLEAETRRRADVRERLDAALVRSALSPEDRRLATELVYGVVRWRRRLDAIVNTLAEHPERISRPARCILRMGVYQLLLTERIPAHAALYEAVALAKRFRVSSGFVNALLRAVVRNGDPVKYPDATRHPVAYLARRYSYPDWLVARWVSVHGAQEAESLCAAYNEVPPMCLRTNVRRGTREALLVALAEERVRARPGRYTDTAVHADGLPPLADLEAFRAGWFSVQDEGSQLAAVLLDPQPGDTVLDLCAAPGGKATHIAERLGDRGRVVANDIAEAGLARVRENAARLGLASVEVRRQDGRLPMADLIGRADRVMLDAPCSGVGVLRRRAEARWGKNEQALAKLAALQLDLLRNAGRHVRPGGVLVYAVCTDTPEETTEVVRAFADGTTSFAVEPAAEHLPTLPEDAFTGEGAMFVAPHRHGMDGFYAIRFRRTSGDD